MTKRILFVDDEPMILSGLQRGLRGMRGDWEMSFVVGGPEALEAMARGPFDVVISDMRMPGMDGAQLLEQVKERFPQTVRMALSGQSDRETILRSIGPTHQYLSKPCDTNELKGKLIHALMLRDLLDNPKLNQLVSQMETVPSVPTILRSLRELLDAPNPSIAEVGNIVAHDMGMTAKVLQLVNSAFLGTPARLCDPRQAVSVIGIDNMRALLSSHRLFPELDSKLTKNLGSLWLHSYMTAKYARMIAEAQNSTREDIDAAFAGGLLHDIGRLLLASVCGKEYEEALRLSLTNGTPPTEGEGQIFGCTHAQIGAYLLGLWGLPGVIVEAVAWHHQPSEVAPAKFCPLLAVHVADSFWQETDPYLSSAVRALVDEDLLARLSLQDRLAVWAQACHQFDLEGGNHA